MTTIVAPDTADIAKGSLTLIDRADAIIVECANTYRDAAQFLQTVKTYRKQVDTLFSGSIKAAHTAHKSMIAAKNELDAPLAKSEAKVKSRMGEWDRAERKRVAEEEARLREAARKAEEDRRLAEAARLEAEGDADAAEQVVSAPVATPAIVVQSAVPKVQGVSTRTNWKFRVVNEALIPRDYMTPDLKRIGAHARSMREKARIPGVEFKPDSSISATGY